MSFNVDIDLHRGERHISAAFNTPPGLTVLFGPSGAGKTSILSAVAGLVAPDRGHIRVAGRTLFGDGIDLPPETRRCGYVFQDMRLFPHMRVQANLDYGTAGSLDRDDIVALLALEPLLDRWPRSLSGGEARRVAIGRALLSGAEFLLMDEPLVSLDRRRAEEIMTLIERIRDELRLPILYVTHDRTEAERLATQIVELARG